MGNADAHAANAMSDFWSHFNGVIWERKAAHLGSVVKAFISPEEIFTLAVNVGEALGRGDSIPVRWCDDGKHSDLLPPNAQSAALLPQRSDKNLDGYNARMESLETFFFRIPVLQLFHPAIWPRLVQFTRNFYPKTGVPGHMAWTDAYFGRYTSTPFGVHLDGASNFTFGINGTKTLYLWEPEFFEEKMKATPHDYAPFISNAIKLTVGAGELIYWPGRYYHIAVPDGVFSVTANFAYYPEESGHAWVERAFGDVLAKHPKISQLPLHQSSGINQVADLCRTAARDVANGLLERQLLKRVVEHTTRLGFHDGPPLRNAVRFEVGDRVVLSRDCELACVPDGNGSLIVSSNGYSLVVAANDTVTITLNALKSGHPMTVDAEMQTLIEEMYCWAALERYWGEDNRG